VSCEGILLAGSIGLGNLGLHGDLERFFARATASDRSKLRLPNRSFLRIQMSRFADIAMGATKLKLLPVGVLL
jgi:hypothetical protein